MLLVLNNQAQISQVFYLFGLRQMFLFQNCANYVNTALQIQLDDGFLIPNKTFFFKYLKSNALIMFEISILTEVSYKLLASVLIP